MGRIRRAQVWSNRLLEQCKVLLETGKLKPIHYAEVATYDLLVKGRLQRIREEYDTGVASLAVARNLLDELASNASTSHDQAISTVFIDEVAPEIRHCAHSLGHKRAYDIDSIVKEVAPIHRTKLIPQYDQLIEAIRDTARKATNSETAQRILQSLEWEGAPVPLRNPELVDAFLKVEIASAKLAASNADRSAQPKDTKSRKKVTAFDSVLQALSDAENIVRKLSEARKLAGGSLGTSDATGGGGSGTRDIHFVHSFTTYQLLTRRTQRDLLLVDALVSNPAAKASDQTTKSPTAGGDPRVNPAVVKIYDSILQTLNQMKTLTIVDESQDVAAATEARIAYIRGARSAMSRYP
jgi:signal recognition particle subunit SRP68